MLKAMVIVPDDASEIPGELRRVIAEFIASGDGEDPPLLLPIGYRMLMKFDSSDGPPMCEFVPESKWNAARQATAAAETAEAERRAALAPAEAERAARKAELDAWLRRCEEVAEPIIVEKRVGMGGAMLFVVGTAFGALCVAGAPALAGWLEQIVSAWRG